MEIQIKPYSKNTHPLGAVLIKGTSVINWLKSIQAMEIPLQMATVYPIPGQIPNSIWGCIVVLDQLSNKLIDKDLIGRNVLYQNIDNHLFIPENALVYPNLLPEEFNHLFKDSPHLIHPSLGLIELKEALNWEAFIANPKLENVEILSPQASVSIAKEIHTFHVVAMTQEELLEDLEQKLAPENGDLKNLKDKPLNAFEKIQLKLLKQLFDKEEDKKENLANDGSSAFQKLFPTKNGWWDKMRENYETLEKRNQKELDKLLEMFKNDPKEALKYAIPLNDGSSRGPNLPLGNKTGFSLTKRWLNFSLFGSQAMASETSGSLSHDGTYEQLHRQYNETALALIEQGEYHHAAFIYLKLLKNPYKAAQALEQGKMYSEAAPIYLKYGYKANAADCFEKGKMYSNSIEVYKELNKQEKVGDLYMLLNQKEEATVYYHKVIDDYEGKSQYIKAANVFRNKIGDASQAQTSLLKGWQDNKDAFNCLNNYFTSIENPKEWKESIESIYSSHTNEENIETFLKVIQYEFNKSENKNDFIRDIAYEIISNRSKVNSQILLELKLFNKNDKILVKDVYRYKQKRIM